MSNGVINDPWWTGQGAADPIQEPHQLNILPRPTPPSPDQIPIRIEIGVTSRVRQTDLTFQPTISYTESFIYPSDLLNYQSLVPGIANTVWQYIQSEQQSGAIVEMHFAVWLDNVTHPQVSAGVVPLAKGHIDGQLSNEELVSSKIINDTLLGTILNIKNLAGY